MTHLLREADLARFATAVAANLRPGAVVWLRGPLGAGKTTLARALAHARGALAEATSPTYGLAHRYEGTSGTIAHVDCYRLRDPEEAAELDWAGLEAGNLLLIEWPEQAGAWAPRPDLTITLEHGEVEDERRVTLVPSTGRHP